MGKRSKARRRQSRRMTRMTNNMAAKTTNNTDKRHRVTLMPEAYVNFPSLYMAIYVQGPAWEEALFAELFVRADCYKANTIEEADLVIFTGGEDVNPALYGEDPHPSTEINIDRDTEDCMVYAKCLELGIPMLGICRGAQFLHVMNGGKLYQDVDEHNGDHSMWDVRLKLLVNRVSSVHHQMCIENTKGGMSIIATNSRAKNRWKNAIDRIVGTQADIEAFFYRDTCCLGIQGHPEYRGYHEFAKWTMGTIEDVITGNPDIAIIDKMFRVKPEVRALRKLPQSIIEVPLAAEQLPAINAKGRNA